MSAVALLHPITEKNPCPYAAKNPNLEIGKDYGFVFGLDPGKGQHIVYDGEEQFTVTSGGKTKTVSDQRTYDKIYEYINRPTTGSFGVGPLTGIHKKNPAGDLAQGARKYQEFHQGLSPDRIKRIKAQNPKALVELGTADRIYYTREEPGGAREYYHDFGEDSGKRPTLATDPKGKQLYIFGGKFKVKDWIYD